MKGLLPFLDEVIIMAKRVPIRKYKERKLEATSILRKLYYFLRKHPENVVFKKIRGNILGYYEFGVDIITLDYRKEIIPTLIHEFIHHLHSDWCETKVLSKEFQIMSVLTPKQSHHIIKLLGSCFENNEED